VNKQVQPPTALDMALADIEKALKNEMFYLALVGALTLIDMCAALESADGRTSRTKLENWFNAHLQKHYPWLQGEDCYGLRCGLVHQGIVKTSAQGHQSAWNRTLFVFTSMKNCGANDAYITSLPIFCRDVCSEVRAWIAAKKTDPNVQKNMQNLMKLHRTGLTGYIEGVPVLG